MDNNEQVNITPASIPTSIPNSIPDRIVFGNIEQQLPYHVHSGSDSPKIPVSSLESPLEYSEQYYSKEYNNGESGTTFTINWQNGNVQFITLTGNCTFTFTNPKAGSRYVLIMKQDGTGSRTVTWPSTVEFSGDTAPTLTTTGGKSDIVGFVYSGVISKYISVASLNFSS